jgi:hypothetical protein
MELRLVDRGIGTIRLDIQNLERWFLRDDCLPVVQDGKGVLDMRVFEIIVGFILGMIALGAFSKIHTALTPTYAGLNVSSTWTNSLWGMMPLLVLFVCCIGSVWAIYDALRHWGE